jgi:hypothetical protein
MKVKVKIKPAIASRGCGFCDIEGGQDVFPPFDENGKPVIDKEFTLEATSFVESKIASGELILIAREDDREMISYEVYVNNEPVTEVKIREGSSEKDIFDRLAKDKTCQGILKKKELQGYEIKDQQIVIKVK